MARSELEFFDPEVSDLRWQSVEGFGGQVYEKILAKDPDTGDETVMVKLAPGVETKELSIHDFWEEAYIIDGVIKDLSIKKVFTQGMYACRPPGMKHGPYEFPYGVTVLEFHYQR